MVAVDEKLIWGPSRKNLYKLAGSFGRQLCCEFLTDPLGGVCASLAPRRRPKLQRHIHAFYFLTTPWRRKRTIARALTAPCAARYRRLRTNNNFVPWGLCGENRILDGVDQSGNTLKYDAWNRLISVTNSSGQVLAQYTYNALSQRVTETYPVAAPGIPANTVKNPGAAAQPRHPASAGFRGIDKSPAQSAACAAPLNLCYSTSGQVLEERFNGTSNADTEYQYVWSAAYANAMVLRDWVINGVVQTGNRKYTVWDANYNVTALIGHVNNDANQPWAVVQRYVYSPYGSAQVFDANFVSTPDAFNWQYMYQGGRFDTATGLYHFGARNYSPSLGIWISQDPLQYVNCADTYQMEMSGPVGAVDPFGHSSLSAGIPLPMGSPVGPSAPPAQITTTDFNGAVQVTNIDGQGDVSTQALTYQDGQWLPPPPASAQAALALTLSVVTDAPWAIGQALDEVKAQVFHWVNKAGEASPFTAAVTTPPELPVSGAFGIGAGDGFNTSVSVNVGGVSETASQDVGGGNITYTTSINAGPVSGDNTGTVMVTVPTEYGFGIGVGANVPMLFNDILSILNAINSSEGSSSGSASVGQCPDYDQYFLYAHQNYPYVSPPSTDPLTPVP